MLANDDSLRDMAAFASDISKLQKPCLAAARVVVKGACRRFRFDNFSPTTSADLLIAKDTCTEVERHLFER